MVSQLLINTVTNDLFNPEKERNYIVLRNRTTHHKMKLASYPRGKESCVTKFIQFPRNLETRLFVQEETWD